MKTKTSVFPFSRFGNVRHTFSFFRIFSFHEKDSEHRKKYFTLIELLIVVVIIAILAAMLLPALNKARLTAYKASCLNIIKQIVLGYSSYTDDNKEWMCPGYSYQPYQKKDMSWYAHIYRYITNRDYIWSNSDYSNKAAYKYFTCPAEPTGYGPAANGLFVYPNIAINYKTSGYMDYRRLPTVKYPSISVIFADQRGNGYQLAEQSTVAFRHGGCTYARIIPVTAFPGVAQTNLAFLDGHCATEQKKTVTDSFLNTIFY